MRNETRKQNLLFASVVGPHGVDGPDSRYKNPMSLLANQVTRGQGHYTTRMFSRTFAWDLFGANLDANVAVLDFPSAEQLEAVLRAGRWDRVGLTGILANFEKVVRTWRIVRAVRPDVPVDLGGHVVNDDGVVRELVERLRALRADETFRVFAPPSATPDPLAEWLRGRGWEGPGTTLVKQDGLAYYAQLRGVGLKSDRAVNAPLVRTTFDLHALGLPLPSISTGLVIPDVGCPKRCDFCTTSHKFGGRFVPFLETAEDLLAVADAHAARGTSEFFVLSENFALDTRRAKKLLALLERGHKPYTWDIFSSADALARLGVETLVKLGVSWVWIGLEGADGAGYAKLGGVDARRLVAQLQAHGIEALGSTILGFDHQDAADLDREIEHALTFGCAYNQFMLYMAMPGTPLWRRMQQEGRVKPGFAWADIHGQHVQNWRHPRLSDEELEGRLDRAFARDYEVLGPSLYRGFQVQLDGYLATADWDHPLVQARRARARERFVSYIPALAAMHADLAAAGHAVAPRVDELRRRLVETTGWRGRLSSLAAPLLRASLALEKRRHERGLRAHRQDSPPCLLTHYGRFEHRYPRIVPAPGPTPGWVAVPRPPPARPAATPGAGQPLATLAHARADGRRHILSK